MTETCDLQGHHPGCPFNRNRPCICEYLRSWSEPAKPGVYSIVDYLQEMGPIQVKRGGIKYGEAKFPSLMGPGVLHMPPCVDLIPTPQNRDAIRRAGLTKERTHGKLLSEKEIGKLQAEYQAKKDRERDAWAMESIVQGALRGHHPMPQGPLRASALAYLADKPALVATLVVQRDDFLARLIYWKRVAIPALIIGGTATVIAVLQGVAG